MQTIRASIASRLFGTAIRLPDLVDVPEVTVKTVKKSEYESSCRALGYGEVISTLACTPNLAIADLIHVVSVDVKGVCVGKLHLRFYREQKKVKRNFVAFDSQVKKMIRGKRDRFSLAMIDWLGDATDAAIRKIANEACSEVERILAVKPTFTKRAERSDAVSAVIRSVPSKTKPEWPVAFEVAPERTPSAVAAGNERKPVLKSSVDRMPVGVTEKGVVVEIGKTVRPGQNGSYESFCLKLDVSGKHIPYYGVELERECAERNVVAGQYVEIVSMGKQQLPGNRHKNLYRINILRK
ncbi:hypothetical protein KXJ72_17780 (plasmid) [Comamonas aquatica]|nr:hypothetical protein KXJ72_17780 [Comamonas aquatica]